MVKWNTDRRNFLKAAGALGAGLALQPRFAWSADGDTLRIRMEGDIQVLDPAFMLGAIEDVVMRGIYVSLNKLGDLREGSPWSLWGAEKLEQVDPTSIAFTLIDGLKWSNGFGPVTAEERGKMPGFQRCIACGLCDRDEGERMARSGGAYRGVMALMLAGSRNIADARAAAYSFSFVPAEVLADKERLCPTGVPMREVARFVQDQAAALGGPWPLPSHVASLPPPAT